MEGDTFASKFRRAWDVVQVFVLLYVAIAVPFRIGFRSEAEPYSLVFWFEFAIDAYFWADIYLNFRTAYKDKADNLVTDIRAIRRRYLRGWFAIDVLACLPVTYIELAIADVATNAEQV